MTDCPICQGTGEVVVIVSEPYDPIVRREYRSCICGRARTQAQAARSGVTGNTPLVGREIKRPDLTRYRLRPGRVRLKRSADWDYGDASKAETVDFFKLHGIKR